MPELRKPFTIREITGGELWICDSSGDYFCEVRSRQECERLTEADRVQAELVRKALDCYVA